jgi:hypothetical protein
MSLRWTSEKGQERNAGEIRKRNKESKMARGMKYFGESGRFYFR